MTPEEMKDRTRKFGLAIIKFSKELPASRVADVLYRQLLRSGTSVGANYRTACRARSRADFISKIGIVEEESDESQYWLEMKADSGLMKKEELAFLIREANELTAIFASSRKTAKENR